MARRVNNKFLIILGVLVLGGVASAFVLKGPIMNMVKGDRSKKLIEEADALVTDAEKPDLMVCGLWYVDKLVRTPDGWRIKERVEEKVYMKVFSGS